MKLANEHNILYKEYTLELQEEEEELLLEVARKEIVQDKKELINYAVKRLIREYIDNF
jgi:hypothetical protein